MAHRAAERYCRGSEVKPSNATGGYGRIYLDLTERLARADMAVAADNLGLVLSNRNEVRIPFAGRSYLVSPDGVRRADGGRFHDSTGSVLIHYVLRAARSGPAGEFITFAELAGPVFAHGSYSQGALERPVLQRFQGRLPELLAAAAACGGAPGGQGGLGSVSLLFDLLPHIPLQLIFYDRDEEFPARATLLFDRNATLFLEFEFFAVAVTLFIHALVACDR